MINRRFRRFTQIKKKNLRKSAKSAVQYKEYVMAKKLIRPKPKKSPAMGGGGMNPSNLMGQFQKMQQEMAATQEKLADEVTTVTAGGGAITIEITGHQRIQSITLNPEIVAPEEIELLQDMLVAGINAAIEQSQTMAAQKMEGLTGGLDVNNLLGGLGGL
jgi:nucleoid-associated protein EbfC